MSDDQATPSTPPVPASAEAVGPPPERAGDDPPDAPADRRRFLHTGLAAAAGAAAGAVLAGGGVAEAANGDPVKVGQTTTGTGTTTVDGSRLQVNVSTNTTTAITGSSNGTDGFGVLGIAGPTALAIGVKGQGTRASPATGTTRAGPASTASAQPG